MCPAEIRSGWTSYSLTVIVNVRWSLDSVIENLGQCIHAYSALSIDWRILHYVGFVSK